MEANERRERAGRSHKRDATRQAIAEAALALFAQHGYDDTSVEAIAERAGVGPATVFRYFGTKDAITFSERDHQLNELYDQIVDRAGAGHDLVVLLDAFETMLRRRALRFDTIMLQQKALESSPVLRGRASEVSREYVDTIALALADRHGSHPSTFETTALMFFAAVARAAELTSKRDGISGMMTHMRRVLHEMQVALSGYGEEGAPPPTRRG